VNSDVAALLEAATRAQRNGRWAEAYDLLRRCEELCRGGSDRDGLAWTLIELASAAQEHLPATAEDSSQYRKRLLEEAIHLFNTLGNDVGVARALRLSSALVPNVEAKALLERSIELSLAIGDASGTLLAQMQIGTRMYLEGKRAESIRLKNDIVEKARILGDDEVTAHALIGLAMVSEEGGQAVYALFDEAQVLFSRLGDHVWQARCFLLCAEFGCDVNDRTAKRICLQKALALSQRTGNVLQQSLCRKQLAENQRNEKSVQQMQGTEGCGRPESEGDDALRALEAAVNRGDIDAAQHLLKKMAEVGRGGVRPELYTLWLAGKHELW